MSWIPGVEFYRANGLLVLISCLHLWSQSLDAQVVVTVGGPRGKQATSSEPHHFKFTDLFNTLRRCCRALSYDLSGAASTLPVDEKYHKKAHFCCIDKPTQEFPG